MPPILVALGVFLFCVAAADDRGHFVYWWASGCGSILIAFALEVIEQKEGRKCYDEEEAPGDVPSDS
jgi:hypothetical protein